MIKALRVVFGLAILAAVPAPAEEITITPSDARSSIPRSGTSLHGDSRRRDAGRLRTISSHVMAVRVTFEPGARTAWHNHPAGQYLIVTSGVGWVQERGGKKREIRSGDVVWTPPGVVHWHGATTTDALSHLAIWDFVEGSGGELMEHVSDEDYLAD